MFLVLGNNLPSARRALGHCGLRPDREIAHLTQAVFRAATLDSGRPDFASSLEDKAVWSLRPEQAAQCSRPPNSLLLFSAGGLYYAAWDASHDGYGLNAFVGAAGERLRMTYAIEAANDAAHDLGLAAEGPYEVDEFGSLTLTFGDTVAQTKIIVRVGKTGDVVIKTEGYTGTACQDATRQLEKALGAVVSERETEEMHPPVENRVSAGV